MSRRINGDYEQEESLVLGIKRNGAANKGQAGDKRQCQTLNWVTLIMAEPDRFVSSRTIAVYTAGLAMV